MNSKPYPIIPNTKFKPIPKSALNLTSDFEWPLDNMADDIFHGYALTSNREVWYGRGMSWRKIETNENHEGTITVALRFFGQQGQTVIPL